MARRLLDTLNFQAEGILGRVYYNDTSDTGRRIEVDYVRASDNTPSPPPGSQYQSFTGQRNPSNPLLSQLCEGPDGVSVVPSRNYPFATIQVEANASACAAATVVCDLAVSIAGVHGVTVTIAVTTSHGPWQASSDEVNFGNLQTDFPLQYGQHGTITVRDAANCRRAVDFRVPEPGNPEPAGDVIDFFYYGGVGRPASRVNVYALRTAPYTVAAWSPENVALPGTLTPAERGRADQTELPGRCGGATNTTRIRPFSILAPPYVRLVVEENSADCGYVPVPPPSGPFQFSYVTGTDETVKGGDGLIQAAVVGNASAVLFSLDNYLTAGLPLGFFPNLRAGPYTVYARETGAGGRTISQQVTLHETPHGPRYVVSWQDEGLVPCQAALYLRGYAGPVEELRGAAEVLAISWAGGDASAHFFDQLVCASEATLTVLVLAGADPADLDTQDERQLRLDVTRAGVLVWRGYVLPDLYEEPFLARPYALTVRATDGLGALEQVPFVDAAGVAFAGEWSHWRVLREVLGRTGVDLPWRVLLTMYPVESRPDATTEVLRLVSCAVDGFAEKEKPWTCRKVLQALLDYYGMRVQQRAGCWYLERLSEVSAQPLTARAYDAAGGPLPAITYSLLRVSAPVRAGGDLYWREARQLLSRHPAVAAVSVKAEPGAVRDYFPAGDFPLVDFDAATGQPLRWTGTAVARREPDPQDATKPASLRLVTNSPIDSLTSAPIIMPWAGHSFDDPYTAQLTESVTLSFTAKLAEGSFTPDLTKPDAALFVGLGNNDVGDSLVGFSDSTPGHTFISGLDKLPVYEVTGTSAAKVSLTFVGGGYYLRKQYFVRFWAGTHGDVLISDVRLTIGTATNGSYINESRGVTLAGPRLTKRDEGLTLQLADTVNPDERSFAVLARSVLLAETGIPVSRWREGLDPATPPQASIDLLTYARLSWQQKPCAVVRGVLAGDCGPAALLVDEALPDIAFAVTAANWTLHNNAWDVTGVQRLDIVIPTPDPLYGLLSELGAPLLSEDGAYILVPENAY